MRACSTSMFIRRLLSAMAIILATSECATATDISDVPMAVKNNVAPNFMYMIDNSGSMSNIVPDAPYSSATTYNCPSTRVVSAGFADPTNPPTSPSYDIAIKSDGTLSFTDGSMTTTVPLTKIYTKYGTSGTGGKCFDAAKYYNFRLMADTVSSSTSDCGLGGTPCKYPGSGYANAVYSGNFLNWYFGTATPIVDYANGRRTGLKTRIEIAKSSVTTVLNSLPLKTTTSAAKVRVGLSSYNGSDGGTLNRAVVDLDSTQLTNLKTSVAALTPSGSTPLSETLADIGHYFTTGYIGNLTLHPNGPLPTTASVASVFKQGTTTGHGLAGVTSTTAAPIQYWCQRSYAILVTDGIPQSDQALSTNSYLCDYDGDSGVCTTSGPTAYDKKTGAAASNHPNHIGPGVHSYLPTGSDYLNDVAQALFEMDLRPDVVAPAGRTKKNNVRTYTVGFADDQAKNDPLLKETASQGGGLFSTAGNGTELVAAFNSAMNDAFAKDAASSAIAVVNTQISVDNSSYASSYNSGFWSGDLAAYTLDTTTGLPGTTPAWSAQAKLDALTSPVTSRNIVTFNGTSGVAFQPAGVTLASTNNTNLVNYLRGDRTNEDGINFRKRKSLLGDIINAEPVVVKYSDGSPVVFQGANDGMLHAFCGALTGKCGNAATAGQEIWAYVPKMVWPNLINTGGGYADPAYAHKYFVDATPAVASIGSIQYLVGGLGKGGQGYYALDISSYSESKESAYATKAKWEFPASASSVAGSVGYSHGTPLIVNTSSGWRVLVTSGYNNADGSGKIFALDPTNGTVKSTITTSAGSSANPAGLTFIAKPAAAAATDIIKYVYGGDLLGNVWRFNLETWTAVKIAVLSDAGGTAQPVSSAPTVGVVTGSTTKNFIYIGTGLYLGDSDVPGNASATSSATQVQSMYGIIDDTSVASPTLPRIRGTNGATCPTGGGDGDFLCQDPGTAVAGQYTSSSNAMTAAKRGWYFDIPISNGRVIGQPQVTSGGALVFTVDMPTNAACDPGGSSAFVNVDASNGGAVAQTSDATKYYPTIISLGFALASRAVVITTATDKRAVIRMSDQTFRNPIIREPPPVAATKVDWKRVYWRELM